MSSRMARMLIAAVACFAPAALAADECSDALLPQIDITRTTQRERYAYLNLVDEDTYYKAETKAALSAMNQAEDFMGNNNSASMNASYSDFDTKRRNFLSQQTRKQEIDQSVSILRQSLTDSQLKAWTDCMLRRVGLTPRVVRDSASGATVEVLYRGEAGSSKQVTVELTDGKLQGGRTRTSFPLSHDGTKTLHVTRLNKRDIVVTANAKDVGGSAWSVFPVPRPSTPPSPPASPAPTAIRLGPSQGVTARWDQSPARDASVALTGGAINSMGPPSQKLVVDLSSPRTITQVVLVLEQTPAAQATHHQILFLDAAGAQLHRDEHKAITQQGETLSFSPRSPLSSVSRIEIQSFPVPGIQLGTEGWVAYREIRVIGH